MINDTPKTIAYSLRNFFSGTLLSRFTGLGREILMAAAFGTAPAVAAFWMAFRFSHLLRRLFGEGGLNVAFIPHFESLRKKDPAKAALFFHRISMGLTILLLFLTLLVESILGTTLLLGDLNSSAEEVVRLTMILLPAIVFICLYALNQSLLNCELSYFTPSVAPAVLNLIWIGAVLFLWKAPVEKAMEKLAMIVVFAFAAQWFITVPKIYKYLSQGLGPRWWDRKDKMGREILALLHPFLLGLIGVAATQVNNALDALFARAAHPEGPAILWYALRIQQLPLALLGVGLTGALLPPISRAIQAGDKEKYFYFLEFAYKRTIAFMIPLMVGLFVLGFSGINLVYGHGEFTSQATAETTYCLWAYGSGLLPMTLVLIFASAFYAKKNYRLPTIASVFSVGINCFLNAFFVFGLHLGTISIAIATSLAACFNGALLGWFLASREGISFRPMLHGFLKVTLASFFAAALAIFVSGSLFGDQTLAWISRLPLPAFPRALHSQLSQFLGCAGLYGFSLFIFAYIFKIRELLDLLPKKKAPSEN